MAAKGSVAKAEIFKKMNEDFSNSFIYNGGKELRINWTEDGEPIQIKVTLTYVKEPVQGGITATVASSGDEVSVAPITVNELTAEEKTRLAALVAAVY